MIPDLSFVHSDLHRRLLRESLDDLLRDRRVTAVLLTGSLARGDALPSSDLDLHVLLRSGTLPSFSSEIRGGVLIERKAADFETLRTRIDNGPMEVYSYLDGRILHDPEKQLERLCVIARNRFTAYRSAPQERREIAYWLRSASGKIVGAREAGDKLKAGYLTATTSWKILEGLWAANDKPMPPSGAVWAHLHELTDDPKPLTCWLHKLFCGDTEERTKAAIVLARRVVALLEAPPET